MINRKAIGYITANYSSTYGSVLLKDRPIASVPFLGRYRLIDFPLSNCANSGIDTVGVQLLAVIPESRVLQLAGANGTVPPAADPAVVAGQAMAKRLCGQRVPLTF